MLAEALTSSEAILPYMVFCFTISIPSYYVCRAAGSRVQASTASKQTGKLLYKGIEDDLELAGASLSRPPEPQAIPGSDKLSRKHVPGWSALLGVTHSVCNGNLAAVKMGHNISRLLSKSNALLLDTWSSLIWKGNKRRSLRTI